MITRAKALTGTVGPHLPKLKSLGQYAVIREAVMGQYAVIREAVLTNIHRQMREKTE